MLNLRFRSKPEKLLKSTGFGPVSHQVKEGSILLCASGGGFKMLEQMAGMLTAFDQHGICPDTYFGSSAGGLASGLHASGMSGHHICELIKSHPANKLISWNWGMLVPFRKSAVYDRNTIKGILDAYISEESHDKVRVTTTRLEDMASVAMPGTVDALMATSAFPEVFAPVKIGSCEYVDGGVLNNIPLPPIRDIPKYKHIFICLCADDINGTSSAFKVGRAMHWLTSTMAREFYSVHEEWSGLPNVTIMQPEPFDSGLLDWSKGFELMGRSCAYTLSKLHSVTI
jgi:NTE family protein